MAPTSGEGADLLPPLKRLRPLEREEEDERLKCGLPAREEPAGKGSTTGEEEERPLTLARDLDMAKFEEISDDCCTWKPSRFSIASIPDNSQRLGGHLQL